MRVDKTSVNVTCHCQEHAALCKLVDLFADEMKKELLHRMRCGKSGWDDPLWSRGNAMARLLANAESGDMVDVANFAMFLWNCEACGGGIKGCEGGPNCPWEHK